jgi:hypothetical protein
MKSFFSRLFGLGEGEADTQGSGASAGRSQDYKGFEIIARPLSEGGQWRVAGAIVATIDGDVIERPFIRADLCTAEDEAIEVSLRKAQQIIDQNPRLFADPSERGPV